ncbi:hypothetical protein [Streptomyces sp. NPDC048565]|uniref:hypothetical protein n=1 Tax=Streptomyces sp. NPDC048565 TaxID=3155266 RepID=UPI003437E709
MTTLCRHRIALLATAVPASYVGEIPGPTSAPGSGGWALTRPARMPLFTGLLVVITKFSRPLENPWKRTGTARPAAAGLLAASFGHFAPAA